MTASRWEVRLTRRAQKDMKTLRNDLEQALRCIAVLETDPLRGDVLKGTLREARSLHFALKGGGQYRAIYVILDDRSICLVFLIAPRENIYDEAKRRLSALELE